MHPPAWFSKSLTVLDSQLRVRRSHATDRWVIDRKGFVPGTELEILRRRCDRLYSWLSDPNKVADRGTNLKTWKSVKDEMDSAETGYRVICTPTDLNPGVFNDLCQADMQRYGGYARFCDAIEADEAKAELEQERTTSNKRVAMNAEVFDVLNFLGRKRAVAEDSHETDLRYMLHGKRTQPGDAPLITLTDF